MKCGKKACPGKAKCSKCSHGKKKPAKKAGKKIPTPKARGQKGAVKSQNMRKRSAY
jgi:hypothetical protein